MVLMIPMNKREFLGSEYHIEHKHVKSWSVFTPFPNDSLRVLDNTIKIEEVRGFRVILFCPKPGS